MSPVRTVIVTTPAILRDLVRRLPADDIELDIVAELNDRRGLTRHLSEMQPDLVVIGLRPHESDALIRGLMTLIPTARFIAFSANARSASGFELRLYRTDLTDLPPAGLVDFIRGCAAAAEGV